MKILKESRKQEGWSGKFTCTGTGNGGGGCGAHLLVSITDTYKTYRSIRDEDETFITFSCPCCGVETDTTKVPTSLWDKVAKNKGEMLKRITSRENDIPER